MPDERFYSLKAEVYGKGFEDKVQTAAALIGRTEVTLCWQDDMHDHVARVKVPHPNDGTEAVLQLAPRYAISRDWITVAKAPLDEAIALIRTGDRVVNSMQTCVHRHDHKGPRFVDDAGLCRECSEHPRKWRPRGL